MLSVMGPLRLVWLSPQALGPGSFAPFRTRPGGLQGAGRQTDPGRPASFYPAAAYRDSMIVTLGHARVARQGHMLPPEGGMRRGGLAPLRLPPPGAPAVVQREAGASACAARFHQTG